MEMISKSKAWLNPLAEKIRKTPDFLYFTMLCAYLLRMLFLRVCFISAHGFSREFVKKAFTVFFLVLLGLFLFSVLFRCVRRKWVMLPVSAGIVLFLVCFAGLQDNQFDGAAIALLAVGAYGRDYRRILKLYLWCMAAVIIIAGIGVPAGFTKLISKVGAYGTGPAYGFLHANVWGTFAMMLFCLAWYLFAEDRARLSRKGFYALSWILAWALGFFMVFVPKCRTAALLLFLFPVVSVLCGRPAGDSETKGCRRNGNITVLCICALILTPFLCYIITVVLGTQREWLVVHTFGTYVENFSKRFIQSGLALKEHGLPLFGELIRFRSGPAEHLGDYNIGLYVLDNAYVAYTILRGLVWMVPALLWLSCAHRKMVQRKDYDLLTISVLFCLMALMERYPFDIYNFVFLYPLASAAGSGGNAVRLHRKYSYGVYQ